MSAAPLTVDTFCDRRSLAEFRLLFKFSYGILIWSASAGGRWITGGDFLSHEIPPPLSGFRRTVSHAHFARAQCLCRVGEPHSVGPWFEFRTISVETVRGSPTQEVETAIGRAGHFYRYVPEQQARPRARS